MKSLSGLSLLLLLCSILISAVSCEFEPDEIPGSSLEKPSDTGPPVVLNLNDYNDTIRLGWTTVFNYSVSGTKNTIKSVDITIGGNILQHYVADNNQAFTFTLDPESLPEGYYDLNIKITTGTGSGSIAEKVGAEGYLYELNWPVLIDKTTPSGFYELSYEKVHNPEGIKLTWPSFNHANFVSYTILRKYFLLQDEPEIIAEITNPLDTSFIDRYFWEGQDAFYYVRIVTPYGFYSGKILNYVDELSGISAVWQENGSLDVTWNKALNRDVFAGYYITSDFYNPGTAFIISDPDENHITLNNTGFAIGMRISLAIIPRGFRGTDYSRLKPLIYTYHSPNIIPPFYYAKNVNYHDFILLADGRSIYRYYPDEQKAKDTLSVNFLASGSNLSVSNNGNTYAFLEGTTFHVRKTDDFSLVSSFSNPSFTDPWSVMSLSLSDNNKLLVTDWNNYVYLYNSTNGNLIRKDSLPLTGYQSKLLALSPDGTRIAALTGPEIISYFSLGESGWAETGTESGMFQDIMFSADGTYIYLITFDKLIKRRTVDFALVSVIDLPGGYFFSMDERNDRVLCSVYYGTQFKILELSTGKYIKSLNLGYGRFTLFKNHIIASGLQMNLTDL